MPCDCLERVGSDKRIFAWLGDGFQEVVWPDNLVLALFDEILRQKS